MPRQLLFLCYNIFGIWTCMHMVLVIRGQRGKRICLHTFGHKSIHRIIRLQGLLLYVFESLKQILKLRNNQNEMKQNFNFPPCLVAETDTIVNKGSDALSLPATLYFVSRKRANYRVKCRRQLDKGNK